MPSHAWKAHKQDARLVLLHLSFPLDGFLGLHLLHLLLQHVDAPRFSSTWRQPHRGFGTAEMKVECMRCMCSVRAAQRHTRSGTHLSSAPCCVCPSCTAAWMPASSLASLRRLLLLAPSLSRFVQHALPHISASPFSLHSAQDENNAVAVCLVCA